MIICRDTNYYSLLISKIMSIIAIKRGITQNGLNRINVTSKSQNVKQLFIMVFIVLTQDF